MGVEHGDKSLSLLTFVNDVEYVARIAAESIKTSNNKFIAGPEELKDRLELETAVATTARKFL
jgi:hypothetical protein